MRGRRSLKDLGWLELAHLLAELVGAKVVLHYYGGYSCSAEFYYTTPDGLKCCTGLARTKDTAEESAEWLVQQAFKYMSTLSFSGLGLPEIDFSSKEELEMKLAAAGVDIEFSLTHGSG